MPNHKRSLHHLLRFLHRINTYVLLGLCVISLFVAVLALRANNQHMIRLRNAVFMADQQNGDIEGALRTLREYVYAHMNTNLASGDNAVKPPIQLKYQYERLQAAATAEYQTANAKVLSSAEATCVAQYPGSVFSQSRLDCAKAYAAAHSVAQKSISEDLYKFDFASPFWSPDLAGWSLVAAVIFGILFLIRFLSGWAIKQELRNSN
jgi:hypothetical protein